MLLESETDLRLLLGGAVAILLVVTLIGFVMLVRASAALRRAQESLAKTETGADRTERRMFQILQAIPVALVETDTSGKFTFANRAAHQLLGRKDAELLGLRFHSATWGITYPDGRLIPPDLLPAARALRGQTVKGFQHLMVNPNTRKKMLVSVTAMPILNDAGEVMGSSSAIVETDSLVQPAPELEDELKPRYFDIAGVMLLALDRDGKVRDINSFGAELLGASPSEIIGRDWIGDFIPHENQAESRAAFQEIARGRAEMPDHGEGWVLRVDGQRRLIAWRGSVVRDDRGGLIATLSSGEDVTLQRAREAAIREAQETSRLAQEAGEVGIWTINPATGEIWNSPVMLKLCGLAEDARPSADALREMIHPDDRERAEAAFAAAWSGETGAYACDYRIQRPDGQVRWIASRGEVARDESGAAISVRGVGYDVTDLKSAEAAVEAHASRAGETAAALADSEARFQTLNEAISDTEGKFRALVEAIPQLVWSTDRDGECDYVSPGWSEFTGAGETAFFGRGWLDYVHPDDRPGAEAAWFAAVRGDGPYDVSYRLKARDGSWRWFQARGVVLRDDTGAVTRWFGTTTDVTDMVDAREVLEQRVAERTAELEAANEERLRSEAALAQAQRLETVGRLTGGVAHDFNNLLTVVIGALDMILRQSDKPERVRRLGEAALAASKRGEKLTRQLLAFSRRQEFRLEVLELAPLIRGMHSLIRRTLEESIPLSVEVEPDLGAAELDPVQFEAALLNLVINARDAVETIAAVRSGGQIEVRARRACLTEGEIADVKAGDYAAVEVRDTGVGMSPEVAARALEPFYTTKEVGKGTGLGLAQVYGFARQSGGGVRIESAPGEGSTVTVFLPLSSAPPAATEAAAPASDPGPRAVMHSALIEPGCQVLLVEDDVGVRTVAENLLLELGCEVTVAQDGAEAMKLLQEGQPAALLMTDIVMPGAMSGVELARSACALRPDLKVLLSTGYAGEHLEAAQAGDWPVLRKPYQSEALASAVREALEAP